MRLRIGPWIRATMLLGLTLTAVVISVQAQDPMNNAAVIGSKGVSEGSDGKIDFENAKALPLPAAPESVAKQAEKDLIENLTHRDQPSTPMFSGHEAASEGDGMTNPVERGIPSKKPNRNDVKQR